jgi:hypothetical protein
MAKGKDAGNVTTEEALQAIQAGTLVEPPAGMVTLPPTLAEGMEASLARMERRATGQEKPLPLPWPGLAAQLGGGLWPQTFTLLVGTTGSGKSQLAVQASLHAARQGTPVLYVALELDRLGMHARTLALALRDDGPKHAPKWSELYLGEDRDAVARARKVSLEVAALPFHLEVGDIRGWSYSYLHGLAEGMRLKYGKPFLLVLDFLQLVDGGGDSDDRDMRLRMKNAANAGREVARRVEGATVFYLSGTSRENYATLTGEESKDKKGKPTKTTPLGQGNPARLVGAAKESGDVEYGADALLVLASEPWPGDGNAPPPDGTHAWVAVAKVRAKARSAGVRPGWVALRFDGSCFHEPPGVNLLPVTL